MTPLRPKRNPWATPQPNARHPVRLQLAPPSRFPETPQRATPPTIDSCSDYTLFCSSVVTSAGLHTYAAHQNGRLAITVWKSSSEVNRRSTGQDDRSPRTMETGHIRQERAAQDLIMSSAVVRNQRSALTQAGAGIAAFRRRAKGDSVRPSSSLQEAILGR